MSHSSPSASNFLWKICRPKSGVTVVRVASYTAGGEDAVTTCPCLPFVTSPIRPRSAIPTVERCLTLKILKGGGDEVRAPVHPCRSSVNHATRTREVRCARLWRWESHGASIKQIVHRSRNILRLRRMGKRHDVLFQIAVVLEALSRCQVMS